jgi:peptide/nickel transport system substrate-binding protein
MKSPVQRSLSSRIGARSRRILAGAVAGALVAVLAACASTAPTTDVPKKLRIAISSFTEAYIVGANPLTQGGGLTTSYTYELLFAPGRDGFEPWLAEEWEVSADGLTMEMKLREDVDFADGEHFDAEALKTYLDTAFAVPTSEPSAAWSGYSPSVAVTGEYTVEITTEKPMRLDFFYLSGAVAIASPASDPDDPESQAGSGAYFIDEIVADVSVKLVRNPDYWDPEAYPFDEVELTVYPDEVGALNALKSGQIDAMSLSPQTAKAAQDAGFSLHEGVRNFATLFFFDRSGAIVPALGDVRVRQAINMAFDREQIRESLNVGFGGVSSQPFTAGQAEYIEGADDRYPYDPERARELLAEAGYPDGFDLPILSGGASAEGFIASAAYEPIVQQSLADIGIRVTFEVFPDVGDWVDEVQSGRHAALVINHYYGNVTRFLDPDTGGAAAFFIPEGHDPLIDPLLEKINRGTADDFVEGSQELGRYLLENAWLAPFSSPPIIWASIPGIEIGVGRTTGAVLLRSFQVAD